MGTINFKQLRNLAEDEAREILESIQGGWLANGYLLDGFQQEGYQCLPDPQDFRSNL